MVACVGGGSNAAGTFAGFVATPARLVGVEAAGGAAVTDGRPGVLHGFLSSFLQDEHGQIAEAHSVSAGLDYPGVGPEHACLAESGRAEYHTATDAEAMAAVELCARTEGILPALESAHALAWVHRAAQVRRRGRRRDGAGHHVRPRRQGRRLAEGAHPWPPLRPYCARPAPPGRPSLVTYVTGGIREDWTDLLAAMIEAGADAVEIGLPFSDPCWTAAPSSRPRPRPSAAERARPASSAELARPPPATSRSSR